MSPPYFLIVSILDMFVEPGQEYLKEEQVGKAMKFAAAASNCLGAIFTPPSLDSYFLCQKMEGRKSK